MALAFENILTERDYFVFQFESLINIINENYPQYLEFLSNYWESEYCKNKTPYLPEKVFDEFALRIANRKLREAYLRIEDSILRELKDPVKRMQFEMYHFTEQKKFLLKKIEEKNPDARKYAELLWKDAYDDGLNIEFPENNTYVPALHYANKELRKFCASLKK